MNVNPMNPARFSMHMLSRTKRQGPRGRTLCPSSRACPPRKRERGEAEDLLRQGKGRGLPRRGEARSLPWRGEAGGRPGPLARLGRDTGAAIGIPGALVAAMLVGATALPVANVTLKADSQRMEDAATAAGMAATQKLRELQAQGGSVTEQEQTQALEREARLYARLNLLDLPPAARRKALQTLDIRMTSDLDAQTVQVDLSATLPGRNVMQGLLALSGTGGTALPEKSAGRSRVQCVSDKVEMVLAIDMTNSMGNVLRSDGVSRTEWPRRRPVALDVAAEMIDDIQSLCSNLDLKVGIVPWASSVRVPDGQEKRWQDNGWIDRSRFAQWGALMSQSIEEQWGGCLEDRLMDTSTRPETSMGLTLDTAEDRHFPPYVYPDTERHSRRVAWAQAMQRFIRDQAARGQTGLPDTDPAALVQVLQGDNDWSNGGGPNKGCTRVGMIPPRTLTSGDTWFTEALTSLREAELTDEGTLAHLGVTWGRRMLHPAWDAIWDPNGAADDAKGGSEKKKDKSVTQVLVLLSDGENSMKAIDPWDTVPGRARVSLWECEDGKRMGRTDPCGYGAKVADLNLETTVVTGYSALGRNGPGALKDGHRRDTRNVTTTEAGLSPVVPDLIRKSRDFIDGLLTASCSEARNEGIEVYTVSLADSSGNAHQNTVLQSCAGTKDAPGASDYAFQATDTDELKAAFREIGQRVARVRRAG